MNKLYVNTPLIESLQVGKNLPARVWLKLEALQPSGSFKARGVGYACQKYVAEGATSLVASSGGNAGLAVAYAGRRLHVPVTVVVPQTTKQRAIDLIESEGATVIVQGENWNAAHEFATNMAADEAIAYIHPFDDPNLWTGHASLVDEIKASGIEPDALVLSVGGGGLLCGVVEGLCRNGWGDVPILAVETYGADSLAASFVAKQHVAIAGIKSVATSLGAKKVAKRAFELLDEHSLVSHVVTDEAAVEACWRFLGEHRMMVEPACGASLAPVYAGCDFLQDKTNVVVIVCGGVGVTLAQLETWRHKFEN